MTRRFLLDTSVAVDLLVADARLTTIVSRLEGRLLISIVTRVELESGVYRMAEELAQRRLRLDLFLDQVATLVFGLRSARMYGHIVQSTGYSRRKLLDRMIAAQALVHGATLVTRNPGDFRDVAALELMAI